MTTEILMVRLSSHIRALSESEFLTILDDASNGLPRRVLNADLAPFEADIEGGHWEASHALVRQVASEVRTEADKGATPRIIVGGIAEIPHVVALGAYIGDERVVEVHDYDRDRGVWGWPEKAATVEVEVVGLPTERVTQPGAIAIRVEVSAPIEWAEVLAEIGDECSADVVIRLMGRHPMRGAIRSSEDVEAVRLATRQVLSTLEELRPSAMLIHLFVAAPVSVSFALGQELHLRNGIPVQTYRYRSRDDRQTYQPAILLSASELESVEAPLGDDDLAAAAHVRSSLWPRSLSALVDYAGERKLRGTATGVPVSTEATAWRRALGRLLRLVNAWTQGARVERANGPKWYGDFVVAADLRVIDPFPTLLPVWELVDARDHVDPAPRLGEYGFDKDGRSGRAWRLPDRLLLAFQRTVDGDEEALKRLIRLFLFHEYLHDWQDLTKYTAEGVGSFANCLERIDYLADTYAILHEHDFTLRKHPELLGSDWQKKELLADIIDLAVRSFWAFQEPPPRYRWQERRLRRFLNWFWRRVQVRRAPTLHLALRVLAQAPCIEIAGLEYRVGQGRILVDCNRVRAGARLEIGLVLEDGRFYRTASVGNMSIEALLVAICNHDHEGVSVFFNSLFENVRGTGGHLPSDT